MPLFTPSRTRTQNFESFQTTQHHQHELDSFNFNFQRPKNTSYITAQEDRNCHTTNKETQSDNSFQHTNPTETYMHVRQSTPLTSTTLFHLALTQAQASTWMGHIYTWCDSPRKRTRDMHVCTFKKAVQTDDMETTITTRRHFEDDCEPPTNKQTSVYIMRDYGILITNTDSMMMMAKISKMMVEKTTQMSFVFNLCITEGTLI